ncbi:MAG: SRPBCC family protein [Acidimicrobiia bacterium]
MSNPTQAATGHDGRAYRLAEKRLVNRPRHDVFSYTADFAHIAQWDPGVVSSSRIDSGPLGVGSSFAVTVKMGMTTKQMSYEITEFVPDERVVLVGTGGGLHAVDEIRFIQKDGSTLIDYEATLTFSGLMGWFGPLLQPVLRRVGKRALDGLAEALR